MWIVVVIGNCRGPSFEPWGTPFLLPQRPVSFEAPETCSTTPGMTSCLGARSQPTLFQTWAGERKGVTTSCQEMILTSLSRFDTSCSYYASLKVSFDWTWSCWVCHFQFKRAFAPVCSTYKDVFDLKLLWVFNWLWNSLNLIVMPT